MVGDAFWRRQFCAKEQRGEAVVVSQSEVPQRPTDQIQLLPPA
jgi:hypothetical protein